MSAKLELAGNQACRGTGMDTVSRANLLEKRLISFAATIVAMSSRLPRTPPGRHICGQILRSGTAAAANYGEARGAESRADFVHKLKVVFKELNETTMAGSHCSSGSAFLGSHCPDCRGESRTLSNYCSLDQDGPVIDRVMGPRGGHAAIGSFGQCTKWITQRTTAIGQLTVASRKPRSYVCGMVSLAKAGNCAFPNPSIRASLRSETARSPLEPDPATFPSSPQNR